MLKASKVQDDSEQSNVVHCQQNNRKRKELELNQQNTQYIKKVCKTSAIFRFVSLARENSLKLIEDDKE